MQLHAFFTAFEVIFSLVFFANGAHGITEPRSEIFAARTTFYFGIRRTSVSVRAFSVCSGLRETIDCVLSAHYLKMPSCD